MPVEIPTDNLEVYAKQMAEKINLGLAELRRLLLVENMVSFFMPCEKNIPFPPGNLNMFFFL